MNQLEHAVTECYNRMENGARQWATTAKREGWEVTGRGAFYPGGPVCVTVDCPHDADYKQYYRPPTSFLARIWDAT